MIEFVDPKRLKNHPLNAEIYGTEVDPEFVSYVRENGIIEPIQATKEYVILSGHRRRQAAIMADIREVPVIFVAPVDAKDAERRLILANRYRDKTVEQKAREFAYWKGLESSAADARRKAGKPLETPESGGNAGDLAAAKVGLSRPTAEAAVKVVAEIDRAEEDGNEELAASLREELNHGSVKAAAKRLAPEPETPLEQARALAAEKAYNTLAGHILWLRNNVDHPKSPTVFNKIDEGLKVVFDGVKAIQSFVK